MYRHHSAHFKQGYYIGTLFVLYTCILILPHCQVAYAYRLTFQPRITGNLTYTDNLFLDSGDNPDMPKETDTYYLITPGFTGEISSRNKGASISYDFGYTRYFDWSSLNSWNHNMGMNGWYQLARHTRLEVNNSLAYTSDPLTDRNFEITTPPDTILPEDYTARRNRAPYLTNYGNINFSHEFGPDNSIMVEYSNGIRRDFNNNSGSSGSFSNQSDNYMRHTPSALITYWFNPRWGIEAEGIYDYGSFENSENTTAWTGRFRLSRRFNPHFEIYMGYTRYSISYDDGTGAADTLEHRYTSDYVTHEPVMGLTYSIARDIIFECNAGTVVQIMDNNNTTINFSGALSLNKTYQHGSVRVYGSAGQAQGVYTSESLGSSIYFETGISGTYQLLQDLSGNSYISFRRDKYNSVHNGLITEPGGNDDNYGAGCGLDWHPYSWLGFGLSYSFRKFDSGRNMGPYEDSYMENRGLFMITLTTPRPWRMSK